jgi:polysaccharide deacetylase family protein (PEP-CTERM system associated)
MSNKPYQPAVNYRVLLTVDVEDWFQVENFKKWIPASSWANRELRVERNTNRILDLFDEFTSLQARENSKKEKIRATFFVLGWIGERLPQLVREIHARGHEVASHGYSHKLCNYCSLEELKTDLVSSKKMLEDKIGEAVVGYRAPSFSVNSNILSVIEECGYLYDSSYNSFGMHSRYGHVKFSEKEKRKPVYRVSRGFYEIPISNLKLAGIVIPWGGGGYFRMIPSIFFKKGVKMILKKVNLYVFYMHPWEIDPGQPRVREAAYLLKWRHCVNLKQTQSKLFKFIKDFRQCRFITCREAISEINP